MNLNESVFLFQLKVRFGSDDSKVMFSDEYEDISAYREIELVTTTTTTTVQPPIELDPIMQAMMQTVNITELEIRFGHIDENGLAVRNAFGEPFDVAPPADTYRWDFEH